VSGRERSLRRADHSSIGVLPSVSGFDRDALTMRRLRHEDCRVIKKRTTYLIMMTGKEK
jgi:hypothetical protein